MEQENNEYTIKAYIFVHGALSGSQRAVQASHAVAEIFPKYLIEDHPSIKRDMLLDWVDIHKTIILLNGGFSKSLRDTYDSIRECALGLCLPHANFYEDGATMEGMMTSFMVIVPSTCILSESKCEEVEFMMKNRMKIDRGEKCRYNLTKILSSHRLA